MLGWHQVPPPRFRRLREDQDQDQDRQSRQFNDKMDNVNSSFLISDRYLSLVSWLSRISKLHVTLMCNLKVYQVDTGLSICTSLN